MPYKSKAQQRYLHATHPALAAEYDKEMKKSHKSFKRLPEHVKKRKK